MKLLERPHPTFVRPRPGPRWSLAAPLGRILYAAIFVLAAPNHFQEGTIAYAAGAGVPAASFLVPLSGLIALAGGLSVAAGYRARWGAGLLVLFLVPVTLMMHAFWSVPDPQAAMMERVQFMKNLALLGAALLVTQLGSGPYSVRDD